MKKRTISLLVAAAITAGCLAGCGGGTTGTTTAAGAGGTEADAGSPQDSASGKDSLVIAMASDILSMDPYKYDEGPTNQVMLHIYEAMLMQDADMKFQPCLAESWETSDDGLTWTFHLRKGVKFHDGEEMDSADVLASIKTAMNPDSPSAFSGYTSTFSKVEAPDAYTITITTETPNPLMLFHVAQIYVLKQENVEGKTEEEISDVVVGTGRYKFVEQVKEDHLDLTANEDYWGEVPEIKNVRFRPITNEATRTATMLTGEVDFTIDISVRDIDRLDGTDGISVLRQQGLREIYLNLDSREDSPLFPGQKNPMSDPKVRHAMYLAIDEDTIIKNIMNGCAFEMNSIIPENYVGYTPVEREAYDPEKAKQLLAEAGYPDGFAIDMYAPNDTLSAGPATLVQQFLTQIGLKVDLQTVDFGVWLDKAKAGEIPIYLFWDSCPVIPDNVLKQFTSESTINYIAYNDPEYDRIVAAAVEENDLAKKAELYNEAQKNIMDSGCLYTMTTYSIHQVVNPRVKDLKITTGLMLTCREAYIEE